MGEGGHGDWQEQSSLDFTHGTFVTLIPTVILFCSAEISRIFVWPLLQQPSLTTEYFPDFLYVLYLRRYVIFFLLSSSNIFSRIFLWSLVEPRSKTVRGQREPEREKEAELLHLHPPTTNQDVQKIRLQIQIQIQTQYKCKYSQMKYSKGEGG